MSTQTRHRVLIAGGGIGGLATALALAKQKIASCIFERRPKFESQGAGIQIGPNGTRVLASLGVSEHLRPRVGVPDAIDVRNAHNAALLTQLPLGSWIYERHGSPYWVAHRADLHAALAKSVETEPLIECNLAKPITSTKKTKHGIEVHTDGGEAYSGEAFVASDGIWSTARNYIFSKPQFHATPRSIGKSAARTVIASADVPKNISKTNVSIWLSPGAHVVHYPVRAGAEIAMIVVLDDTEPQKEWDAEADPDWIKNGMRSFASDLQALIESAKHWRKWSLYDFDYAKSWVDGPMALLGDAAHPVLPFLAQGAVMTLEDAVTVSACLAKEFPNNIGNAFCDYERQRKPRALAVQRASRRNGQIYHLSGLMAQTRDLTLRTAPPTHLIAQYDWLYSWKVA